VEEMANCMLQVACSSTLRERLANAGIERSRQFSWESCARRTAAELRTCLDMK